MPLARVGNGSALPGGGKTRRAATHPQSGKFGLSGEGGEHAECHSGRRGWLLPRRGPYEDEGLSLARASVPARPPSRSRTRRPRSWFLAAECRSARALLSLVIRPLFSADAMKQSERQRLTALTRDAVARIAGDHPRIREYA